MHSHKVQGRREEKGFAVYSHSWLSAWSFSYLGENMIGTPSWVWEFEGELPGAGFEDQSLGIDLKGGGADLIWTAAPKACNSVITSACWDTADKDSGSLCYYIKWSSQSCSFSFSRVFYLSKHYLISFQISQPPSALFTPCWVTAEATFPSLEDNQPELPGFSTESARRSLNSSSFLIFPYLRD